MIVRQYTSRKQEIDNKVKDNTAKNNNNVLEQKYNKPYIRGEIDSI